MNRPRSGLTKHQREQARADRREAKVQRKAARREAARETFEPADANAYWRAVADATMTPEERAAAEEWLAQRAAGRPDETPTSEATE